MENPKTPETLEIENPGDKTPKEASASYGMSDIFSGLASVSDIPDDFGDENLGLEAQVVKDDSVAEDLAKFEAEETGKVCYVSSVCVGDDVQKDQTKIESVGLSQNVESEAQLGLSKSVVVVKNVEVESQIAKDSNGSCEGEVSKILEIEKSCANVDGVEVKGFSASDECDKDAKLDEEKKSVEVKVTARDDEEISEKEPSNTVEFQSEGISLYVDICGSPSGLINKEGNSIDDQDSNFITGDIVWAKTRKHTWWPGKICHPVDAPKFALRTGSGGNLLVGYYGTGQFSWCFPSQLKPFHEAFDRFSRKNRASSIFLGAVQKAAEEFGVLVKSEMTCSCGSNSKPKSEKLNRQRLGEFLAANFEPVAFLERVKHIAQVVSVPRLLDASAARNCILAFYWSVGHKQMAMNQLADKKSSEAEKCLTPEKNGVKSKTKEKAVSRGSSKRKRTGDKSLSSESRKRNISKDLEAEVEDDTEKAEDAIRVKDETMEKGLESRERKKSRYLSYPYVNFEQKSIYNISKIIFSSRVSHEANTYTGEKFWRKWYHHFTEDNDLPGSSEMTNVASAELLSSLYQAAMNGLNIDANKGFTLVGCFFSKYRVSVYHDESAIENCLKNIVDSIEVSDAAENKVKLKRKSDKKKGKSDPENTSESLGVTLGTMMKTKSLSADKAPEKKLPKRKSDKKKQNPIENSPGDPKAANESPDANLGTVTKGEPELREEIKTKPISGLSDLSLSAADEIGASVQEALEADQPLLLCKKAKQRRKKQGDEFIVEFVKTVRIPDLNGSGSFSPNLKSNANVVDAKPELSKISNANEAKFVAPKPSNVVDLPISPNGKFGPLDKNGHMVSTKSTPKKRKKPEKKTAPPENIPDLNDPNSASAAKEEPEKKTKRKKIEVVLNYPRNQSPAGTTLNLDFAPGALIPPREDLVSVFRKFGTLKEADIRISNDPGTAQIVFVNVLEASEALRSLEKNNPFGVGLVNFKLSLSSASSGVKVSEPNKSVAAPPLDFIKQNLKMMTEMLEKAGDDLSQEMRAKLEGEIKGLLSKVSSMGGTCS